ncbi:hypothetical protein [Pedobacter sp. MW01-1-1]|uniref:hypothetical protein n=1 Tax=Pedobacter sp. MW01-1-1 TaxID=3383027 RepID=UPI003FEE0C12
MKKFFYCFAIFCFAANLKLCAQPTATGCYIPAHQRVYTQEQQGVISGVLTLLLGGNTLYSTSTATDLPSPCTGWIPVSSTSGCQICPANNYSFLSGLLNGCNVPFQYGTKGTFQMVNCPLDEYAILLPLLAGVFGYLFLSKQSVG